METNKILEADILDLVFDGRNKEYGAYDLRKHYNARLGRAIGVTAGLVVVLCSFTLVRGHRKVVAAPGVTDISLLAPPVDKTPPPVIPKPIVPRVQPVATIRFVTPRVVPNDQVKPEETPPENKELDNVRISTATKEGTLDDGAVPGPTSDGVDKGIVEKPKADADDEKVFYTVEIESSYPGGIPAWARFLNKNLRYPDEASSNGIQGTVLVQFIVDKDGNVSDVQAVSGPTTGGLREEAIRVIKKSGKWTPAMQNGRVVKSYKRQPVVFQIADTQ
jgi:protein TonB